MKVATKRAIVSPHPKLHLARPPMALLNNPGTMLALLSERHFLGTPCSLAQLGEGVRQCQEVRWKCESKVLQTHLPQADLAVHEANPRTIALLHSPRKGLLWRCFPAGCRFGAEGKGYNAKVRTTGECCRSQVARRR